MWFCNSHVFAFCCKYVCILSCLVTSDSLWPHGLQPAWFVCPSNFFLGKNIGVGSQPWDLPNPGIEPKSLTPAVNIFYLKMKFKQMLKTEKCLNREHGLSLNIWDTCIYKRALIWECWTSHTSVWVRVVFYLILLFYEVVSPLAL